MTSALCRARLHLTPPDVNVVSAILPRPLNSLSVNKTHLYGRGHTNSSIVSMLSCLKLCCTHGIKLNITRELFSKIILSLNMPKINRPVSDSRSLNLHRLLSCVELDFLLASCRLTLCWLWCLQRPLRGWQLVWSKEDHSRSEL